MMDTLKHCTICSQALPATAEHFYRSKRSSDGLQAECKICHNRRTSPEQHRESSRRYHQTHRDSERDYGRRYFANLSEEQKEKHREATRRWRHCHRDIARHAARRWKKNNRDRVQLWRRAHRDQLRHLTHQRRMRIRHLPHSLTREQWQSTLEYFDHRCAYCGAHTSLAQEHIIPVDQGGGLTQNNIIPACRSCNSKKGNRTPAEAGMTILKPWPIPEIGT